MFVHPEVDFKKSKTQIILKRKKKTVIVKPYRKISWQLPKTKQGKSRDQSQISSPASISWSFSKTPFCGGKRGYSQEPGLGRNHWNTSTAVQMVMVESNIVFYSVQVQRVAAMQSSGSQTLYTYSTKWTHTPVHGIQVQHSCTRHWELSKSKDLKRS